MTFTASSTVTFPDLAKITAAYQQANARAVEQSTQIVFDHSQEIVPVDTGELKESGHTEVEAAGTVATGSVVYDADHAAFVEFGTGQRGAASPGAGPYPYDPNWPGMVAQPYIRPALDQSQPEILEVFKENYAAAGRLLKP